MSRFTTTQLHAAGYRPDGTGRYSKVIPPRKPGMLMDVMMPHEDPTPADRLPGSRKMTDCEARFFLILQARFFGATIIPQFRVRVSEWNAATVVHYTCDFAVFTRLGNGGWVCNFWECKDKRRKTFHSDELTRPKMCRAMNQWIDGVYLATWDGEAWTERRLA